MRGLAADACFARMTSEVGVDVEVDGVAEGEGERLREESVEGRPLGFLKNGTSGLEEVAVVELELELDGPGSVVEVSMVSDDGKLRKRCGVDYLLVDIFNSRTEVVLLWRELIGKQS